MTNNKRLIEEWLPIKEIGVESRRENSTGLHPPPNRLHVWWARRPLTASRAAILGTLLPAWEGNEAILRYFKDEAAYHAWVKRLLGIWGDPVASQAAKNAARAKGVRLEQNPFTHGRAFSNAIDDSDRDILKSILATCHGTNYPVIMDSMSGGGSIPFESVRLGLSTIANELNPVSTVVLEATVKYPGAFRKDLAKSVREYGLRVDESGRDKLAEYFPALQGEVLLDYLWARTVPCPQTGKAIPLAPNWWLRRQGDDSVAVRLLPTQPGWTECRFEIVRGKQDDLAERYAPDEGTIRRGNAVSPWSPDPVPGDYIKRMAQEGKMGAQLYALCIDRGAGRDFRLPNRDDLEGVRRAEAALKAAWNGWLSQGLIPTESIPEGHKTDEPRRYGMDQWHKLFAPRQLLALVTYLETLKQLVPEMERDLGREKAAAVRTYLALVLDKCTNYDSSLCIWHSLRNQIANTFDRHDFAVAWSFAEMNMALKTKGGFPWALDQVVDAYEGLCKLLDPSRPMFTASSGKNMARVMRGNAAALRDVPDASVDAVIVDPPYGDNVMYAELSDFFYVWLKRSIGDLYPDWFQWELTDKNAEAVANPARFKDSKGARPKDQATQDYLLKMRRIFREMRRVTKPTGAMCVMFTHKKTEMWNALGLAMLETGWEVGASWPVHTESEHSLHQAKKNAARSTVLLFCRPRELSEEPSYWDQDQRQQVRATARQRALEYQAEGIEGVDLYLATYGPVLGALSKKWPILSPEVDRATGEAKRLDPEAALSIARREVAQLRLEQMLQGRVASWDPATQWYVLAWDSFKAREFPFDDAHKMAMGMDVSELITRHRLLKKKGDYVVFLRPDERQGDGRVEHRSASFGRLIDGLHTAMLVFDEEGERACRRFLEQLGYLTSREFRALVTAALNSIPRRRNYQRGQPIGFAIPEAETLEKLRLTFFPDVEPPPEPNSAVAEQAAMDMSSDGADEE